MEYISHGGPGSGRYPKGSGKKYLKKDVRALNKILKESVKSEYKNRVYMGDSNENDSIRSSSKNMRLFREPDGTVWGMSLQDIKRQNERNKEAQRLINKVLSSKQYTLKEVLKIDLKTQEPYTGYRLKKKKRVDKN